MTVTKTWKTAPVILFCGYCREKILKGARYLEVERQGIKKTRLRCETCAEREE